jgi:hypothetical protein
MDVQIWECLLGQHPMFGCPFKTLANKNHSDLKSQEILERWVQVSINLKRNQS